VDLHGIEELKGVHMTFDEERELEEHRDELEEAYEQGKKFSDLSLECRSFLSRFGHHYGGTARGAFWIYSVVFAEGNKVEPRHDELELGEGLPSVFHDALASGDVMMFVYRNRCGKLSVVTLDREHITDFLEVLKAMHVFPPDCGPIEP
jgi:hypothetical protein